MGITNRLFPTEVTTVCNPGSVPEPNDQPKATDPLADIDHFARFMRASKVPPRDEVLAKTADVIQGEKIFQRIGCSICHVATLTTAPVGTPINGGQFTVPDALGNKTFHPYSDFLLHNVGTGDGIAISVVEHYAVSPAAIPALSNSKPSVHASFADFDKAVNRSGFSYKAIHDARNKVRTAPLWGLRTHSRLMHDGDSLQLTDAIKRHNGEASAVARRFILLTPKEKQTVLAFLASL
jgi:CxxC motif-containing protein (DUF1111 family)